MCFLFIKSRTETNDIIQINQVLFPCEDPLSAWSLDVERWTLNANWSLWIINPALNFFSSLTFNMRRQEPKRTMVMCRTKNKLVYGKYSVFLCKHVSACVGPHKTKMTFTIHNATIKTCDLKRVMTLLRIVSYLYDIFSLSEWSITLASNRPHDGWF